MYRSADTIEEFCRRTLAAASELTSDFELILVNDGSPDDSLARALALQRANPRIAVVDLARNFGHHPAMMCGLAHARGELVFLIDSDLEEDPAWLSVFHRTLVERDADVAYGVQRVRKGRPVERLAGWLFYSTLNLLFDYPIPRNVITARLMTRRYVRALLRHRERTFAIAGLWSATGYLQEPVVVDKRDRRRTTYTLARRVSAVVNATTAGSARPLVFVFYAGVLILLLSFAMVLYLVIRRLFFSSYLPGWVSVFVSIWFLGGLTVFCLGVIGVYLSKIFVEVKQRPRVIVRAVYRRHDTQPT